MKVRIAVGLGATAPDAHHRPDVVALQEVWGSDDTTQAHELGKTLGIDHIFFRPGREGQHVIVEATRIVGDAVDGVFPSDHRAVVADLRWRG
jgi:endonuclease/exonuclease/phosphatase family metal-dependent hydrolase